MKFSRVTLILRGYSLEQVDTLASILLNAKVVKNIEITVNTDNAFEIIKYISEKYSESLLVGAGTVQTYEELENVVKAGAKFVLSPRMMTKQMFDYCNEHKIISIPGAFTPSEIGESISNGANVVKVFPANELSLNYARKVCEPMGNIKLMAVGGINKNNVQQAFDGGYCYVGTAGGIFNKKDIIEMNVENLRESLKEFESAIK